MLADIVREHFVTDLTNDAAVAAQLTGCFTLRTGELLEGAAEDAGVCLTASRYLVSCSTRRTALPGNIFPDGAAYLFLGFDELTQTREEQLRTLLPPPPDAPSASSPNGRGRRRRSGPATIDYAGCLVS